MNNTAASCMTQRQWLAGQALAGILSNPEINMKDALTIDCKELALCCWRVADAIRETEKDETRFKDE